MAGPVGYIMGPTVPKVLTLDPVIDLPINTMVGGNVVVPFVTDGVLPPPSITLPVNVATGTTTDEQMDTFPVMATAELQAVDSDLFVKTILGVQLFEFMEPAMPAGVSLDRLWTSNHPPSNVTNTMYSAFDTYTKWKIEKVEYRVYDNGGAGRSHQEVLYKLNHDLGTDIYSLTSGRYVQAHLNQSLPWVMFQPMRPDFFPRIGLSAATAASDIGGNAQGFILRPQGNMWFDRLAYITSSVNQYSLFWNQWRGIRCINRPAIDFYRTRFFSYAGHYEDCTFTSPWGTYSGTSHNPIFLGQSYETSLPAVQYQSASGESQLNPRATVVAGALGYETKLQSFGPSRVQDWMTTSMFMDGTDAFPPDPLVVIYGPTGVMIPLCGMLRYLPRSLLNVAAVSAVQPEQIAQHEALCNPHISVRLTIKFCEPSSNISWNLHPLSESAEGEEDRGPMRWMGPNASAAEKRICSTGGTRFLEQFYRVWDADELCVDRADCPPGLMLLHHVVRGRLFVQESPALFNPIEERLAQEEARKAFLAKRAAEDVEHAREITYTVAIKKLQTPLLDMIKQGVIDGKVTAEDVLDPRFLKKARACYEKIKGPIPHGSDCECMRCVKEHAARDLEEGSPAGHFKKVRNPDGSVGITRVKRKAVIVSDDEQFSDEF